MPTSRRQWLVIVGILLLVSFSAGLYIHFGGAKHPVPVELAPASDLLAFPVPERPPVSPLPLQAPQEEEASIVVDRRAMLKLSPEMLPYERTVAEAVANSSTIKERAEKLLALLPSLPPEGLPLAAGEAINGLADADYAAVVAPVIANRSTHGAAMSVLFADLMERPDRVALPPLLAIARNPQHPYAPYARDNLSLLLGVRLAEDWAAWERAIQQRLASKAAAPASTP